MKNALDLRISGKAAEDWPHSKTLREEVERTAVRQVLECGKSSAAFVDERILAC
jgi:hypothetical protein